MVTNHSKAFIFAGDTEEKLQVSLPPPEDEEEMLKMAIAMSLEEQ